MVFLLQMLHPCSDTSFPHAAVGHRYIKPDFPNILILQSLLGWKLVSQGEVYTPCSSISYDSSEVICWRHLAPYREDMSTYKLRLVPPSPFLTWEQTGFLILVEQAQDSRWIGVLPVSENFCAHIFFITDFYESLCAINIRVCGWTHCEEVGEEQEKLNIS